jgi:hypothetical protein
MSKDVVIDISFLSYPHPAPGLSYFIDGSVPVRTEAMMKLKY